MTRRYRELDDRENARCRRLRRKDFAIGNHQFDHKGGTFKLDGYIGLVRVYDRVLNAEDVNSLFEHSKDRFGLNDDEIP